MEGWGAPPIHSPPPQDRGLGGLLFSGTGEVLQCQWQCPARHSATAEGLPPAAAQSSKGKGPRAAVGCPGGHCGPEHMQRATRFVRGDSWVSSVPAVPRPPSAERPSVLSGGTWAWTFCGPQMCLCLNRVHLRAQAPCPPGSWVPRAGPWLRQAALGGPGVTRKRAGSPPTQLCLTPLPHAPPRHPPPSTRLLTPVVSLLTVCLPCWKASLTRQGFWNSL